MDFTGFSLSTPYPSASTSTEPPQSSSTAPDFSFGNPMEYENSIYGIGGGNGAPLQFSSTSNSRSGGPVAPTTTAVPAMLRGPAFPHFGQGSGITAANTRAFYDTAGAQSSRTPAVIVLPQQHGGAEQYFFLLSRVERLEDQSRAGLASLEAKIQTMMEQFRHDREETKQELKQELTKLRNGLVKMGDDILTGTQVTGKVRGGVSGDDDVEEMED